MESGAPARSNWSLSGTLAATVTANATRYSTSAATSQGSAGRPWPRRARNTARAISGIVPTKGSMNTGLRIALLMPCIVATNVWSEVPRSPGITE